MTYHRRIIDDVLDELMTSLPAILIDGPRGIGKTTTAVERAATVWRLDVPTERKILAADPDRVGAGDIPIVVDEWQAEPSVWDRVRRAVDLDPRPGRFLLTGSALPAERPVHSGAARIVTMRMRPLALAERWDAPDLTSPTVSLAALLGAETGDTGGSVDGETAVGLDRYVDEIVRSGLPSLRQLPTRALDLALSGYVENALSSDFEAAGYVTRIPDRLRRWTAAYAAATATTTSWTKIGHAAEAGGAPVGQQTAAQFREALTAVRLLDDVPAWLPSLNLLANLARAPKHFLADPALAVSLLGVSRERLLSGADVNPTIVRDGTLLGALFESLVALCLQVYATAADARLGHLRVRNGRHEVDFIIEGRDRSIVAVEVKLAADVTDRDVRHLNWLDDHLRTNENHRSLAAKVVVTTGRHAYRRDDGVLVVPLALLGP